MSVGPKKQEPQRWIAVMPYDWAMTAERPEVAAELCVGQIEEGSQLGIVVLLVESKHVRAQKVVLVDTELSEALPPERPL